MFQTELILWLQGFDAPAVFWLMRLVTHLGYGWIYTLLFLVLAFGFRLKPLLGVSLALVLASAATDALKLGFALPRPNAVDSQVLKTGKSGTHRFEHGSAPDFWSLPVQGAVDAERRLDEPEYGFPSGHVAMAAAFAFAMAWLLPARGAVAWSFVLACLAFLMHRGFPDDAGSALRRLGRVACALVLGFGLSWVLGAIYEASGWPEGHAMGFVFTALSIPAAVLGTIALARGMRLYRAA